MRLRASKSWGGIQLRIILCCDHAWPELLPVCCNFVVVILSRYGSVGLESNGMAHVGVLRLQQRAASGFLAEVRDDGSKLCIQAPSTTCQHRMMRDWGSSK